MEEKVYTIGKGKMLFRAAGEDNYHDCGNAPDFKIATGIEKKSHFSSRSGTKTKDKDPVIQQTATGSLTLDDMLNENLRMWLMASAIVDVVQAAGTVSAQAITAELDKWIDLAKRKISSVVVKAETPEAWQDLEPYVLTDFVLAGTYRAECTTAGTSGAIEPTWAGKVPGDTVIDGTVTWTIRKLTYILDTDYRLDTEVGHIMPLSDGDIEDAQALKVDFSHAAITIKRISAATVSSLEGHVWFVGNPPIGRITDVKGYCSITPKGDLMLVGDDYTNLQFELEFLTGYGYTGPFDLFDRGIVT